MGSNGGDADERPVHPVTVRGFELDTTEVTVERYTKCYHAGPCTAPDTGPSCNWGHADRKQHPINCVDAEQARAFCAWDKKRLPTEEELEYAAVGTDDRMYPWGNDEPTDERLCWGRRDGTCPVGTHPKGASFFGVHDLAGNVSEWTLSAYCDSYARRRNCTTGRVFRGASFIELRPEAVRSAFRDEKDPKQRTPYVGFRCARPR
jgi:formylglycine-generating enzyme required for sulfatase activity